MERLFEPLGRFRPAIMYCFVFIYIAAAGPGGWAIDAMRKPATA